MKTFEINTPHHGYNGSILPHQDKYLFFFRHEKNVSYPPHFISCCWLNKKFTVISPFFRLPISGYDPRPFYYRQRIYLSYTDDRRVFFAKLFITPFINYPLVINNTKIDKANFQLSEHEKNWLPFVYQDELYCIYSFNPHHIIKIDLQNHKAETFSLSQHHLFWKHGYISGGSVPIDINPDEKISFFHSWTATGTDFRHFSRTYHIGAYTFSSLPPFRLLRFTTSPINLPHFHESPIGHMHRTLFPTSVLNCQSHFKIVYGEHDITTKIVKITLPTINQLLIKIR